MKQGRPELPWLVGCGDVKVNDEHCRGDGEDPVQQRVQARPGVARLLTGSEAEDPVRRHHPFLSS